MFRALRIPPLFDGTIFGFSILLFWLANLKFETVIFWSGFGLTDPFLTFKTRFFDCSTIFFYKLFGSFRDLSASGDWDLRLMILSTLLLTLTLFLASVGDTRDILTYELGFMLTKFALRTLRHWLYLPLKRGSSLGIYGDPCSSPSFRTDVSVLMVWMVFTVFTLSMFL